MTDAAFTGEFSDFKLVKTRSTAQIIIELPIEQADAALTALGGLPKPGAAVHVAVARVRLKDDPLPAEEPKRTWDELSLPEQAGIMCEDEAFYEWLRARSNAGSWHPRDDATDKQHWARQHIRLALGVSSRSQLSPDNEAGQKWLALDEEYRQSQGLIAERTT